jgi:tetratricopeptide (TPR) repeat protein
VGAAAVPVVLTFLLVLVGWRLVYSQNRDLFRAGAREEILRRTLPFIALTLMALSVLPLQAYGASDGAMTTWALTSAGAVFLASLLSIPGAERRANVAFRRKDYETAAAEYRKLAEKKPLARYHAFLGAVLAASGEREESLKASTRAIELDSRYGIAYYNRALALHRMGGNKGRARKDLQRALEADLPRRYRNAARKFLEDLK